MKSNDKGFSLVELIIVIAIMAILAAAITPALIRYIDKSRKAVDIETAEVIFKAAQLASTSEDEEVAEGWALATTVPSGNLVARSVVTDTGHNATLDTSYSGNTYTINCVAWSRGINYGGNWQNIFKELLADPTLPKGDYKVRTAWMNKVCILSKKNRKIYSVSKADYDWLKELHAAIIPTE